MTRIVRAVALAWLVIFSGQAGAEDGALKAIKLAGVLNVGTDIPYGVMEFYDESGRPVGIDMDIGRELAAAMGVEMKVTPMPFDDLFDAVLAKRVDIVLSAVTITPERQKTLAFSAPYLDAGLTLAVRKERTDIQTPPSLTGKSVGVLKGTTGEAFVSGLPNAAAINIVRFTDNAKRLEALRGGAVDAITAHFLTKADPAIRLIEPPLKHAYYGVVARPTSKALMKQIQDTLRELKRSGRLSEIKEAYTK